MKLTLPLIAVFSAILALSGCGGGDSNNPPPVAVSSPAALVKTDTLAGTGTVAALGQNITVHYTGWLYDSAKTDFRGAKFQSTVGGAPVTLALKQGQIIEGWAQGLPGMKVGGKRTLLIPASLAYGATGRDSIPPNSGLVFDIELVAVTN